MRKTTITLILVSLFSRFTPTKTYSISTQNKEIDIRQYIPESLSPWCHLVILSKRTIDLVPPDRPVILVNEIQNYLNRSFACGVLFIPAFQNVVDQFFVPRLILQLERTISTILILAKDITDVREIKKFRNVFKIINLMLIDEKTGSMREISRGSCGSRLKCALKGQSLRVGYPAREPYFTLRDWEKYKENEKIPDIRVNRTNSIRTYFWGLEVQVLELLIDEFGLTFDMIAAHGLHEKEINRTWQGRHGLLERNEVDMIVGHIVANSNRSGLGHLSRAIVMEKFTLCSRAIPTHPDWIAPFRPFPFLMWTLLLACIIAIGPAAWGITKLHRKWSKTIGKDQSLLRVTGQATSCLLAEPWRKPPEGPASLIIFTWLLGCLILQSIYSSNFVAHLSIPPTESPLDTLDDVLENGHPLMSVSTTSAYIQSFKKSKFNKLANMLVKRESDEHLFNRLDEGYVTVYDAITFSHLINKYKKRSSDYHISAQPFLTIPCGWLFANSDGMVVDKINMVLLRLYENGLLEKWIEDMIEETGTRYKRELLRRLRHKKMEKTWEHKDTAISLSHLQGVFLFWAVGLLAASSSFIFEKSYILVILYRQPGEPLFPYLD